MADDITISQTIFAAGVGAAVSFVTNFIWSLIKERKKEGILLVGLTSEIKVIREDLSTHLKAMRDDLKQDIKSRPDDVELSLLIFTANAGDLGLLDNGDLVDHLVETYSSLNSLIAQSHFYKRFTSDQISHDLICEYHVSATIVHLQVINLHKKLSSELKRTPQSENETEKTSRSLAHKYQKDLKENTNTDWMHKPTSYSNLPEQD